MAADRKDQFPAGMSVLVVDDDSLCLMILERMLRRCNYQVTTCQRATSALALLRENRDKFDLVISDVYMPDMDGFKLLELIGLEMDLPVIMMSADGETSVVMKGITHGACDYLIKPVRLEELRNIWQHVIRKKRDSTRDVEHSGSVDDSEKQLRKCTETPNEEYTSSATEGNWQARGKKRKDPEAADDKDKDDDDPNGLKKSRIVWSVELHQQFVNAVNQLGIEKAVPKRILEIMKVTGLTRENVASHLQKYRLYLKRLSGVNAGQVNSSAGKDSSNNFAIQNEAPVQNFAPRSPPPDILPNTSIQQLLQSAGLGQLGTSVNASTSGLGAHLGGLNPGLGGVDPALLLNIANLQALQQQQQAATAMTQPNGLGLARARLGNPLLSAQAGLLHGLPGGYEMDQLAAAQRQLASLQGQQQRSAMDNGAGGGGLSMQQRLTLLQSTLGGGRNSGGGLGGGPARGIGGREEIAPLGGSLESALLLQLLQTQQQQSGQRQGSDMQMRGAPGTLQTATSLPGGGFPQRRASSSLNATPPTPPGAGGSLATRSATPPPVGGGLGVRSPKLRGQSGSTQPIPGSLAALQNLAGRGSTGGTLASMVGLEGNHQGFGDSLLDTNRQGDESGQPFARAFINRGGRMQQAGPVGLEIDDLGEVRSNEREFGGELVGKKGVPSLTGVGANSGTFTGLINLADLEGGGSPQRWGAVEPKLTGWVGLEAIDNSREGGDEVNAVSGIVASSHTSDTYGTDYGQVKEEGGGLPTPGVNRGAGGLPIQDTLDKQTDDPFASFWDQDTEA